MGCYEHGATADSDGDILSDDDESIAQTAPSLDDTDGDGLRDGLEVLRGSDPLVPTEFGILRVPSKQKTIQLALCVAMDGEEIIVSPGAYLENIEFGGKNVILRSTDPLDPAIVASTVIDGNQSGPVVTFSGSIKHNRVLSGFTIRNGKSIIRAGGICGSGWLGIESGATIHHNTITENTGGVGGGVGRGRLVQYNVISKNTAGSGGGVFSKGVIRGNIIVDNTAGGGGGVFGWSNQISYNVIAGNKATTVGGGVAVSGFIWNNLIVGNSADDRGGALANCEGIVANNTIVDNSAVNLGGGLSMCTGQIVGCIIWGNASADATQLHECSVPTYCCIQNWTAGGQGNAGDDPKFVDPDGPDNDRATYEDNDYRLLAGSPCVDAGTNEGWWLFDVDLDGNPRIFYGESSLTVDMGAYEYNSCPFKMIKIEKTPAGETELTWNSRPADQYAVQSCLDLLAGSWNDMATIDSQGASTTWTDMDISSITKSYRIELR